MSRPPTLNSLKTVGRKTPRIDAVERSTGKATYTGDVHLPGMLYARIVRPPRIEASVTVASRSSSPRRARIPNHSG